MTNIRVHITVLTLAAGLLVGLPASPAASVAGAVAPAKKVPGRTLIVKTKGLPGGTKVNVTVKRRGVVRSKTVGTTKRFKNLAPGRYRVKAAAMTGFVVSPRVKRVRITALRGKRVTFTYRGNAQSPPAAVTGLLVNTRTSQAITLSWNSPATASEIVVRRAVGTTAPSGPSEGTGIDVKGAPNSVKDDTVAPATTYSYSVFARNSAGTSGGASVTTRSLAVGMVDGGANFTCGLDGTGKAFCWGVNPVGQLGNNSTTNSSVPVPVNTAGVLAEKILTALGAGAAHGCVLSEDAKVSCWGYNIYGQLGNGTTTNSSVPVAVDSTGVLAGKTVTDISVGGYHACALAGGAVYCWGYNVYGQLGNGTTTNSSVPVAVDTTGVLAGKTIVQVAAGYSHTCVRDSDGKAYCWGNGTQGSLGNNTTTNSAVPVAVSTTGVLNGKTLTALTSGEGHSCALADQLAYCWGYNFAGQVGDNTTTNALVPVAVNTATVLSGRKLVDISAGSSHTCALDEAGLDFCWGYNIVGQLGNNTATNSAVAVPVVTSGVLSGKKLVQVGNGSNHSCAVASGGKAYCWGFNTGGQLGNGTTANSSVPVEVSDFG